MGRLKHGMANTPIYNVFKAMNQRCSNRNNKEYKHYGAKGIKVEWSTFQEFYLDMGDRPDGMWIERIDSNKNYCKENCKWATIKEQQNNTSRNHNITYSGKTRTLTIWCEELELNYSSVKRRIYNGWSIEDAFNKPFREPVNYITHKGIKMTVKEWSKKLNLNYDTIRARIKRGWDTERILSNVSV